MSKFDLITVSQQMRTAWHSMLVGHAAGAQIKVLEMNADAYPDETHEFDEALLVIDGVMNLKIGNQVESVKAGQVYFVPAGLPHAVAPGSHGTLVIIDR